MEFATSSHHFNFDMGMESPSLCVFTEEDEEFCANMTRHIMDLTGDYDDDELPQLTKLVKPTPTPTPKTVTKSETKSIKPTPKSVTTAPKRSQNYVAPQGSGSFWQPKNRPTYYDVAPFQPVMMSSQCRAGTGVFIPQRPKDDVTSKVKTVTPPMSSTGVFLPRNNVTHGKDNKQPRSGGKVNESSGKGKTKKNKKPVENKKRP